MYLQLAELLGYLNIYQATASTYIMLKETDMILCDPMYLSRIAVDKGDPSEVIPISFNALAQYRLALDYVTEMITHFIYY